MSGGGTNTVTNSGPPAWAQPYYESYLQKAGQVSDLPYQPYTGQRTADLNPAQLGGLNATANRAIQGSQEVGAARQNLTSTLRGDYLSSGNPHLQSQIDQAQGDVVGQFNNVTRPMLDTQMARSGSFGNSGIQQMQGQALSDLTKNLGNISSGMRYQNYADERGRQMQGMSLAPTLANQDYIDAGALTGVGDVLNRQTQSGLDQQYQNFLEARNYPKEQLGVIGQALGLNSGQTSSTQAPGVSPATAGLGGAAAGASLAPMLGVAGPYGAAAGAALGLLGSK